MHIHPKTKFKQWACALALAACAPALHAATFDFHVTLDVASLIGKPNSPFFVEFQLNDGSNSLSNTATLSGFTFTGGNATGSPASMGGNETGNLSSTVTLTQNSSSTINEFYQGFSLGTTKIDFNVSLSQNGGALQADQFLIAVLDSESGNPQLYTTAPDTLSLVSVGIASSNTLPDAKTYTSADPSPLGVTATVTTVPEPASVVALAGGACMLLAFRPRRRSA